MAIEILAPAGSFESLQAAVRCGANAVYLGGKAFNARRNASNFSDEDLMNAVDYCHKRNVKVYLTLNTLVSDSELPIAYDAIKSACEAGITASSCVRAAPSRKCLTCAAGLFICSASRFNSNVGSEH